MWCQNCNIEFEDGFTVCLNCGNKLVDYKPIVDDISGEDEIPDDDESILSDEELMREFGDMEFSDGTDVDPDEIAKNV